MRYMDWNTGRVRAQDIINNWWLLPARGARLWLGAAGIASLVVAAPLDAYGTTCRPKRPLPAIVVTSMGPCHFDPDTFGFAGDPAQQAACLVRPVARWAKLGPVLSSLPPVLADRVGRASDLPDRTSLGALLAELHLDGRLGEGLLDPVSRANDDDPLAPVAKYLVIHDTSGPKLGSFPANLDSDRKINNLARFHCSDSHEIAHIIVNRGGDLYVGHDLSVPWRATKFERALNFGVSLKGLFLHVEFIQPRHGGPGHHRNDIAAPTPGFSPAQYDRLALIYALASVRAGQWLVPAFHAVIDNDIRGGHDDPQNFDLESFAHSLEALLDRLSRNKEPSVVLVPAAD
jgi:hypothetical protein